MSMVEFETQKPPLKTFINVYENAYDPNGRERELTLAIQNAEASTPAHPNWLDSHYARDKSSPRERNKARTLCQRDNK